MTAVAMPGRMGVLVGLGAALWLVAALGLRMIEPLGLLVGPMRVAGYALALPIMALTVWGAQKVVGYARAEAFGAISVMTMVAICLDGIAFGFFPGLYGVGEAHRLGAAGVVLWGGGVGMVLAYLWSRGA